MGGCVGVSVGVELGVQVGVGVEVGVLVDVGLAVKVGMEVRVGKMAAAGVSTAARGSKGASTKGWLTAVSPWQLTRIINEIVERIRERRFSLSITSSRINL